MLTKRHFEEVARRISMMKGGTNDASRKYFAAVMAAYFQEENPNFDREKFMAKAVN